MLSSVAHESSSSESDGVFLRGVIFAMLAAADGVGFESYLVTSPRRCRFWIMALIIWGTPVKERRCCWVNRLIGERWRSVPLKVTKQWITATRSALSIISFLPFILFLSLQHPVPLAYPKELKKNTNESRCVYFFSWSDRISRPTKCFIRTHLQSRVEL